MERWLVVNGVGERGFQLQEKANKKQNPIASEWSHFEHPNLSVFIFVRVLLNLPFWLCTLNIDGW